MAPFLVDLVNTLHEKGNYSAADSAMISSIITDLTNNPLAYKTLPWLKMLGDAGELALWKILLEPEGKDKLDLSQVEIKPKLEYDPAKKTCRTGCLYHLLQSDL